MPVEGMNRSKRLYELVNTLANETEGFLDTKGPGEGNRATNTFVRELQTRALADFDEDFSEKKICGNNSLAADYYFPEEGTIVEIALGLKKPNTEYEKDILKAIMAKSLGNNVKRLFFISKPGGERKCEQPGRKAVMEWLENNHGISIEVCDIEIVGA